MRASTSLLLALVCVAIASPARALVIDFESFTPPSPLCSVLSEPAFSTQGFTFTALDSGNNNFVCFNGDGGGPSNGTNAYVANGYRNIQLARSDGAAFDLIAVDIAEGFRNFPRSNAGNIDITGALEGGGTVAHNVVLDGLIDGLGGALDFQHVVLPATFRDLVSVTFLTHGTFSSIADAYLDNLDVGGDGPSSVPEPGSVALLGAGLLLLAHSRRRTRASGRGVPLQP